MNASGSNLARRLVFPVIIVSIALAIGLWTTQGGSACTEAVERFVRQLCMETAAGNSTRDLLALSNPLVAEGVSRQIGSICVASGGNAERLAVRVTPGDLYPQSASETATHSVIISEGKTDMLGLRVSCKGKGHVVHVLGYWTPQPN